jgi:hypothetical protein
MWKPTISDLAAPNPRDFEFIPNIGYKYIGDGRSVILSSLSITKPDVMFDDRTLFDSASAHQAYFDGIGGLPKSDYEFHRIYTDSDFPRFDTRHIYKFVTEDTYSSFIQNGSFLLSSLKRYRQFEEQGDPAGDRFEGSSFCAYAVGNRELTVSTLSGFDTFIFSATRDLANAEEMKVKFGPVILRIELIPFARGLARAIGHHEAEIRLVSYADLKMHRSSLALAAVAGFPPNITPRLAKALRRRGRLPSVFAKPNRFASEREVRIAFVMPQDVPSFISIKKSRLLNHVERLS